MTRPTLSVMISNYNHAHYIPEALDAILAQSFRPMEIVIIEDGSTDDSVAVLERYRRKAPDIMRIIHNESNRGVMDNAARLVGTARGEYVYFAAMDDRILPGFFEHSLNLLAAHPAAGLCSTLSQTMNNKGEYGGLVRMPVVTKAPSFVAPRDALAYLKREGNWIQGNTTILRRTALLEAGGLRAELGPYCDGFMYLVIALKHGVCFIPETLAVWRRMNDSFSQRASLSPPAMLAYLQSAERLMRSEFADRFPEELIEEWKRDMYFGAAAYIMSTSRDRRLVGLRQLMPDATGADRVFDFVARLAPGLGRAFARPYLFLRFKRRHLLRFLRRRMMHVRLAMRLERASRGRSYL